MSILEVARRVGNARGKEAFPPQSAGIAFPACPPLAVRLVA